MILRRTTIPESTLPSDPVPLITRIEPLRRRGLEARVHLDRGEPFEVMLEALERHRLGVGDPLPPERRHLLLDADGDLRVREAALNLISYRARTRDELRRRLHRKGFQATRIDTCLDHLQDKGLIDDEAVAAAFIRDRLRQRPRGRVALSAELRAKGIPRHLVDRAIDEVFDEQDTDDRDLARAVAEQWVARQPRAVLDALVSEGNVDARVKAKRRLVGYLARRGFRGDSLSAGIRYAHELSTLD